MPRARLIDGRAPRRFSRCALRAAHALGAAHALRFQGALRLSRAQHDHHHHQEPEHQRRKRDHVLCRLNTERVPRGRQRFFKDQLFKVTLNRNKMPDYQSTHNRTGPRQSSDKGKIKKGEIAPKPSNACMHGIFKIIKVFWSVVWTQACKNPKTVLTILSTAVVTSIICSGMTSSPKLVGEVDFPHATPVKYSVWQDCEQYYKCTSPSVQNGDLEFELHDVDMPDVFLNHDTGSIMIHSKSCGSIQVKVKSKRDSNVMLLTVKHEVPNCIPAALAAMQQNEVTTPHLILTGVASAACAKVIELAMAAAFAALASG